MRPPHRVRADPWARDDGRVLVSFVTLRGVFRVGRRAVSVATMHLFVRGEGRAFSPPVGRVIAARLRARSPVSYSAGRMLLTGQS